VWSDRSDLVHRIHSPSFAASSSKRAGRREVARNAGEAVESVGKVCPWAITINNQLTHAILEISHGLTEHREFVRFRFHKRVSTIAAQTKSDSSLEAEN